MLHNAFVVMAPGPLPSHGSHVADVILCVLSLVVWAATWLAYLRSR